MTKTQGLNCPSCGGMVPVPEGVRIVECPFCQLRSLVQGELGVRRWQVACKIDRPQAIKAVNAFFSDMKKARGLKKSAQIREVFLVYLPYWRVTAFVAGWLFGRVKSGKDSTRPVEVQVLEEMHWNDAAADVSEFGVQHVSLSKQDLLPYNPDLLHSQAMVFEPAESRSDALAEAEQHFIHRARHKRSLQTKHFEKFHLLHTQTSLVYYPLWVVRYEHRQRHYQVVVDGVHGRILYGKAPGNIFYRAAVLVLGMALGNFVLVNGTIIAARLLAEDSDKEALGLLLLPVALGIGLIVSAYRAFRYGEEVEDIHQDAKKAALAEERASGGWFKTGLSIIEELSELKK